MSERPFSVTKVISAAGGLLLVASFFLPVISEKGGREAADLFGVRAMRAEIERSRELEAVKPLIEPALRQLEAFAAYPSLRNLAGLIGQTEDIVETVAGIGAMPDEARNAETVLSAAWAALWLVPLVGTVQLAIPVLTGFRGYAGFLGLVARFGFGLLFVLLASTPLIGAPSQTTPYIGTAVYTALIGGASMLVGGVCGVTRGNFLFVFLAQAGIVATVVYGLARLAEMAGHA